MKIKRYMADSMRVALAQVRAEQGADAVILSSRRTAEGIEVIAAVDYDEALFIGATQPRAPASPPPPPAAVVVPAAAAAPAPAPSSAAPEPAMAGASETASAPAAPPVVDGAYLAMRREIKDLRELLEGEFSHMSWNDKRLRQPLQTRILEQLTHMDIAPDVALALATGAPRRTKLKDPATLPLALLVKHLQVVGDLSTVNGGVIALVGPTGAGKTTTIAKLAARWSMRHGSRGLALVSTDGYRIGAREQLATYARILGAQMFTANNGKELARVLARLKSKQLVLIDTAGMGPRDSRLKQQLDALQLGLARAQVLLTLPAPSEAQALDEIVRSFAPVKPAACVLTKVDEAASLGPLISTLLRHRLRVAYVCNGQRVPEDLHSAADRKIWLVRAALKLKERSPTAVPEAYFAKHFGRAPIHA